VGGGILEVEHPGPADRKQENDETILSGFGI
jgi:hypothetical protein